MEKDPADAASIARIAGLAVELAAEAERLMGQGAPEDDSLRIRRAYAEMRAMARLLAETRAEVAAIAPGVGSPSIDGAGDILDAVVGDTERAAFEILQSAESIISLASTMQEGDAEVGSSIVAAATGIVTACSFQDLTAQRTRRVVKALRDVEGRIEALVQILGIAPEETEEVRPAPAGDAALLNGPSLDGLGQGEVDDVFN